MTDLEMLEVIWPLGWEENSTDDGWRQHEAFFRGLTITVYVREEEVLVGVLGCSRGHAHTSEPGLAPALRWLATTLEEESNYLRRESDALRGVVDGYWRSVAERGEA